MKLLNTETNRVSGGEAGGKMGYTGDGHLEGDSMGGALGLIRK